MGLEQNAAWKEKLAPALVPGGWEFKDCLHCLLAVKLLGLSVHIWRVEIIGPVLPSWCEESSRVYTMSSLLAVLSKEGCC